VVKQPEVDKHVGHDGARLDGETIRPSTAVLLARPRGFEPLTFGSVVGRFAGLLQRLRGFWDRFDGVPWGHICRDWDALGDTVLEVSTPVVGASTFGLGCSEFGGRNL